MDLGLNLALPDVGHEPERWFLDVERIARVMGRLHGQFKRDFVIGIAANGTRISEGLFMIKSEVPDLTLLRQIVGVEPQGACDGKRQTFEPAPNSTLPRASRQSPHPSTV